MKLSKLVLNMARICPLPVRWTLILSRAGFLPYAISEHWFAAQLAPVVGVPVYPVQWLRTVMYRECAKLLAALDPSQLDVLEISPGDREFGSQFAFKSVSRADYPSFDICRDRLEENRFDLIIADQVFEHLLWPYRAARNVHAMLKPGGHCLITTPFLLRVHNAPVDCSRWTELGIRYLLAECGFPLENITTGSWGNRECVRANFNRWVAQTPLASLHNEPDFPVVVWALARKQEKTISESLP
jgi:SAM-dependent methyltransferase